MKRLMQIGLVAMLALPCLAPAAESFELGRDYLELPFPQPVETGAKIEVREYFWYGCPHCYHLEPELTRWLKKIPARAQFVRTPGVLNPVWALHAQAYYAFESLGVVNKLHAPFFRALQEEQQKPGFDRQNPERNPLYNENSIADFVARHGVDRKKFIDAFRSFSVDKKVKEARARGRESLVNSVPVLVVDGKYQTSPALANGEAAAMRVLDFLINKAAKERKPGPPR
jgi:thiol:disulfide interchange protein DsbA